MSFSSTAVNGRKSTSTIPTLSTTTATTATFNTAATAAATASTAAAMTSSSASSLTKDATRRKIELMEAQREQRRRDIQLRKVERKQEEERNLAAGNPGDVDFIGLVRSWRAVHKNDAEPHYGQGSSSGTTTSTNTTATTTTSKLCICVRKRPLSEKERVKQDHDSISCYNPHIWVHSAKYKVDGITKYLTHTSFKLDHAFNEQCSTQDVYLYTTLPLVDFVTQGTGGRATVFCYGQTGSGKTFTMKGLQHILCHDLYGQLSSEEDKPLTLENISITVAFFELYGGFIQDLLHDRQRCKLLEDAKGEVNITGLTEFEAPNPETFLALIEAGNK
jgi:kinesin family member 2/24